MVVKSDGQSESFLFPLEMLRGARSLASIVCPKVVQLQQGGCQNGAISGPQEVEGAKCLPLPG